MSATASSIAALVGRLDALRDSAPHCRLVAYCDLDTRLVLRHVAEPAVRQELLDRLSEEASAAFRMREAALAALPPTRRGETGVMTGEMQDIRLIDDRGVRLFLRSRAAPSDALILLCTSSEAADALHPAACRLLRNSATAAGPLADPA